MTGLLIYAGRVEQLACQIIACVSDILAEAKVEVFLMPYAVVPVARDAALTQGACLSSLHA